MANKALEKLHALAVRHGIDPTTGHALSPSPTLTVTAAERALCDAWGEYAKSKPKAENTLTSANAFVAGWLAHTSYLIGEG